jgi:hypothetical protein
MTVVRSSHLMTLLNSGKVLVTGGSTPLSSLSSAELYDPATGIFTATGSMTTGRGEDTATLLNNGKVLMGAGFNVFGSMDLYDPATGLFTATDNMTTSRSQHSATLLNSGKVLIAGGCCGLASAELYTPPTLTPQGLVSIAVTPSNSSVLPSGAQKFVATGTFGDNSTQQLASVTWSSSNNAIVTVTDDATNSGVAYGVAPAGSATISACAGLICGSSTVTTGAAPIITSANSAVFTVGALGSFTVTATGSPTPVLVESGTLPTGLTFNTSTGLLAGTPATGTDGTYNLTFRAQNGIGSDAVQSFTLSIVLAPVISSFTAASDTIVLGSSTTLTPVFSNGAGSIDNGIGVIASGAAKTVTPTSTTTYTLTVTNAAGTSVTASAKVTVNNPIPTITSLAPAHANAGAAISTLTVNGANFILGAVVNFSGKAETTTFINATQLTATVPAADNAVGGSVQVTVTNPAPGGGASAAQTFTADSFTETEPSNTATVAAGQPAQFTIMIAPSTNGFSNTVTLGATGLPQGADATFSQNPVVAGAAVTMTLTTTARSSLGNWNSDCPHNSDWARRPSCS